MDADILDPGAFAKTDRDAWRRLVDKALKGADFDATLVSKTDDGLAIAPIYDRRTDATPMLRRASSSPWTVTQRMDDPDIGRGLRQLSDDLTNGATGISLVLADSPSAFGTGLAGDLGSLPAKLAETMMATGASLRIEAGASGADVAARCASALEGRDVKAVHFGLDPLSAAIFTGEKPALGDLSKRFRALRETGIAGTIINADGRPVHNAGGTEAQELAFMAASITAYLRVLDADGIAPEAVLQSISLCLSADQDQFVTVAKARAARLIFARITDACGLGPLPVPHLFMETSYRMLTRLDPETNILRNTIAVFAAGTGGVEDISVLPHTLTHGIPDPLARRLARNTQMVLMVESHLDKVNDPAAGAGGIEALTDAIAGQAWGIFTGIEGRGGLVGAIGDGSFAQMIATARQNRPARRIVGTTVFTAAMERPVTVLGPLAEVRTQGLRTMRFDEGV